MNRIVKTNDCCWFQGSYGYETWPYIMTGGYIFSLKIFICLDVKHYCVKSLQIFTFM